MKPLPRKPVVVVVALVVAALHLVTGPQYRGPSRPFVTGYLIDLALPFSLVLLLGMGFENVPALRRPGVRATAVILFGAGVEALRYVGVPLFGRTFDPIDLVMYAAGALCAVAFERAVIAPYPEART